MSLTWSELRRTLASLRVGSEREGVSSGRKAQSIGIFYEGKKAPSESKVLEGGPGIQSHDPRC